VVRVYSPPIVRIEEVQLGSEWFYWLGGLALLVYTFRAGQQFERSESQRRQAEGERESQHDGALNYLALAALAKGRSSPEFDQTLRSIDALVIGTAQRWALVTDDEISARAACAAEKIKDPAFQYYHNVAAGYASASRTNGKVRERDMSGALDQKD
jgi:hypothetical protein